jgi:hypothetical protein
MTDRLADETSILYVPKFREYGLPVSDGGSSFVCIRFCPWCGARLPASLRDQWFDALEKLGLDPYGEDFPEEFISDSWWKAGRSDSLGDPVL